MKTVCKKLLCLMLVAMMLVSAVPFAFAAEGDDNVLWLELWVDGAQKESAVTVPVKVGDSYNEAAVKAFAEAAWPAYFEQYEFVSAQSITIADGVNGREVYLKTKVVDPCAAGHTYDNGVITTEAGCETDGVKTFTCDCGDSYTEAIEALDHNMVDGVCTRCGERTNSGTENTASSTENTTNDTLILTLWADKQQSSFQTITMAEGGVVPSLLKYEPAKKSGYTFDHWETVDGKVLTAGKNWASSFGTHFYPVYFEDYRNDGVSKLNVNVVFYADGIKRSVAPLFTEEFTSSSKTTMYDWLKSDGGVAEIKRALDEKGYSGRYTWDNKVIYSTEDTGYEVTKADMDSNGAKNVYIKVNAKAEYMADVFVYVHKDKDADSEGMLEMKGYMLGDNIPLSAVKTALKNAGYSYSSVKMYNDTEWAEVVRGEHTTDRNNIEATGKTKIHVYLSNASYNSNADSSNPKTGDYITIAATTMVLAAAALVSVLELKKRKMI